MSVETKTDNKFNNIITFCKNCNNLMHTYIDEENNIFNGCKVCLTIDTPDNFDKLINTKQKIDISGIINRNPYLLEVPTLSITKNPKNIKCINDECPSNNSKKVFSFISFKYDVNELKFLYKCTTCNHSWTNI